LNIRHELSLLSDELIHTVVTQFALNTRGIHGPLHWGRVLESGLALSRMTGANRQVVSLFAFFHDSKRINDERDPEHGLRGADYALAMRGKLFDLNDAEMELLHYACKHHSDGLLEADVTIQTCWDADRLDLGRVGIMPRADRLCTEAARQVEIREWANHRSENFIVPDFVRYRVDIDWKSDLSISTQNLACADGT
jgi:uncharacterized protein